MNPPVQLRLKQPYPFYYDPLPRVVKITVILAVVIPVFMLLFEPFNVNYQEHRFPYPLIAIIFGITDSTVFFLVIIAVRKIFPGYAEESRWTLIRELSLWAAILLCIGITNFLLRDLVYMNPNNSSLSYLLEEITHSYLIGLLIATVMTLVNFTVLVISTANKASGWDKLVQQLSESAEQPQSRTVTICADSPQDEITFDLADLMYVRVDGNYVEFYLRDDEKNVVRYIKRNTLKHVEEQLQPFPNVLRVHRSYLINLDHVRAVEGNAQGYRLSLEHIESVIPVSRSYIPAFDAVMNG